MTLTVTTDKTHFTSMEVEECSHKSMEDSSSADSSSADSSSAPINMDITTTCAISPNSITTTSSITDLCEKEKIIEDLKQKLDNAMRVLNKIPANSSEEVGKTVADLVRENTSMSEALDLYEQQNMYWIEKSKTTNNYSSKKVLLKEILKKKKLVLKMIRDVMSNTILPFIKFVPKTSIHSIAEKSIGATVMAAMDIPKSDWHKWWSSNQILAEHIITEHKTKTTQAMKLEFNKGMTCFFMFVHKQTQSITPHSLSLSFRYSKKKPIRPGSSSFR